MISNVMKRLYILFSLVLFGALVAFSQDVFNYHKSSLYSIMLKHENQEFCEELVACFNKIPIPEKFNDHNLQIRVFKAGIQEESDTSSVANQKPHIDALLKQNAIGRRLVAKWFNYSKDGTCNLDLIEERGYYNVSVDDVIKSQRTLDSRNLIQTAGAELIEHTYVLVNDICYGDKRSRKEERMSAAIALGGIPGVGMLTVAGAGVLAHNYSGFNVTVTSYLYKLNWTDETELGFYNLYWSDTPNAEKKAAFNKDKELFTLEYVGHYTTHSENANLKGVNDREMQIRKVCTRAIDKSIAQLQKQHPQFRVRTPLSTVSPITAKIGLREDITENSLFEVLEVGQAADGRTTYKRVATIRPKKGAIWDNRYLAEFEDDYNHSITSTEFELVSGSIPYAGMLIREIDK